MTMARKKFPQQQGKQTFLHENVNQSSRPNHIKGWGQHFLGALILFSIWFMACWGASLFKPVATSSLFYYAAWVTGATYIIYGMREFLLKKTQNFTLIRLFSPHKKCKKG